MSFLWLNVDDPPSSTSDRGRIERGAIALLSNHSREPIDPPSASWLGRRAASAAIRRLGLWNVNHVLEPATDPFLSVMEHHVSSM